MTRPFRFGFQLTGAQDDAVAAARRAEAIGFDTVLVADHVGPGRAPLPTLAAIAQATEHIRLGPFVLNNDMHNPVQLAWTIATIDRLSGGRFELGLGAGHTPHEYAETGIAFDPPAVRKERMAEALEIIRDLLEGEEVSYDGTHYQIEGARIDRPDQEHLPILIGGNGAALLGHAGAHADIIGLQGLGRTLPDGHRHAVNFDPGRLDRQIDEVRAGAGPRFGELELNALVQVVEVTNDRAGALAAICDRAEGLTIDDADEAPYLLVGTIDEMVEHIVRCRDRWGISYFAVRELDGFEPVLRALR